MNPEEKEPIPPEIVDQIRTLLKQCASDYVLLAVVNDILWTSQSTHFAGYGLTEYYMERVKEIWGRSSLEDEADAEEF